MLFLILAIGMQVATPVQQSAQVQQPTQVIIANSDANPTLSTSDKIAIQTTEQAKKKAEDEYKNSDAAEQQIMKEWSNSHPGFRLNPRTFAIESTNGETHQDGPERKKIIAPPLPDHMDPTKKEKTKATPKVIPAPDTSSPRDPNKK